MEIPKIPKNTLTEEITEISKLCKEISPERGEFYSSFNPPATESEITEWETKNGLKIPESYKDWLRFSNGSVICGSLMELYSINEIQMYDQSDIEDYVIIGSVIGDGEILCFSKSTGKIFTDNHGEIREYINLKKLLKWTLDNIKDRIGYLESTSNIIK
jgi:hypothetical protein